MNDCSMKEELTTRIQALCPFGKLEFRIFNLHNLTIETKMKVNNQSFMTLLMYGSEISKLYHHQVRELYTIQQYPQCHGPL